MNDSTSELRRKKPEAEGASAEPVHTVREGAVAASIWLRQSPAGYPYFDFSLSRSWKSMSTEKTGYSKNFFSRNTPELLSVIERAAAWIEHEEGKLGVCDAGDAKAA